MNWWQIAVNYVMLRITDPIVIITGSFILTLLIVIPVLYFESKIRNRKDR